MKLITKPIAAALIAAYEHSAETGEGGKDVVAKFFTPWTNCTWYISEGMPVTEDGTPVAKEFHEFAAKNADKYDWHLFGWCDLGIGDGMAELGYVMLSELKALKGPGGLGVERDLHYSGELADIVPWMEKAA